MNNLIGQEMCDIIINRYYDKIFKYCIVQLKNYHLAEECTQDVFLLFFKKYPKLDITDNISSWLYSAADKICKKCRNKNKINAVDINEFADIIADKSNPPDKNIFSQIYDALEKDDADLFIEYMGSNSDERKKLAERLGITTDALYKRIERIKKKLNDYFP